MGHPFRAAVALFLIMVLFAAGGCRRENPATAETRDSSVDKQNAVQSVENNPNIPPQARDMVRQQIQSRGGYSSGPPK